MIAVSEDLRVNKGFVLGAMPKCRHGRSPLEFVHYNLRDDPEVVRRRCLYGSLLEFEFVSERLKQDKEFMFGLYKNRKDTLRKMGKDVVLHVVAQDAAALYHASDTHRADPEIVLMAADQDLPCLRFMDPEIVANKQVQEWAQRRFVGILSAVYDSDDVIFVSCTNLAGEILASDHVEKGTTVASVRTMFETKVVSPSMEALGYANVLGDVLRLTLVAFDGRLLADAELVSSLIE